MRRPDEHHRDCQLSTVNCQLMTDYDVIVIGAGAAGMMCAAQAGQRGRRVLLIEHYRRARREDPHLGRRPLQLHERPRRPGELPLRAIPTSAAPRSRATRRAHFTALVERHGIAWHEKKLGQLFCDGSARQSSTC